MTAGLIHDVSEPYSPLVRKCFAHPSHAGDLPDAQGEIFRARRSESEHGATVELELRVSSGAVAGMRFRVFGCPHLVAAAEWICNHYEGRPVTELGNRSVDEIMRTLQVPIEKTGRILLLEDTLSLLAEKLDD